MANENDANGKLLKAVILAAGKDANTAARRTAGAGEARRTDHAQNASSRTRCDVVAPGDIYVVVGTVSRRCALTSAPSSTMWCRRSRCGTGHAVLQACASRFQISRQPADSLRRHAAVPAGLHPRIAQPAPPAKGAPDAAHGGGGSSPCPTGASSATPAARSSTSSRTPRRRPRCARSAK